jgi:EmrB/QacA subfamily drug resistance transporter
MTTPKITAKASIQPSRWLVLALLCAAQFAVVLDFSQVNVALPSMQRDLGFSQQNLQWVVSAYALTYGSFLLLGGRAADMFGRRRVLMWGVALFTVASLVGGLAQSQWALIWARAVEGVGGAIVSPAALSILTTTFAEGSDRNRALGIWGTMGASGFAIGVLLGGILTDGLSWRWILFTNIPIGLMVLVFAPVLLREEDTLSRTQRIDVMGAATITIGLSLLVYTLTKAPETGWLSPMTLLLSALALGFLALFVWIESRVSSPMLPLSVFSKRTIAAANLIAALMGATGSAVVFILTLYMQQVLGYSALQAGLAFLPNSIAGILAAPLASKLVTRLRVKTTMIIGLVISMVGIILMTGISANGSFKDDLLLGTVVFGCGFVFGLVTLIIAGTAGMQNRDQGLASGLLNTSQQVGSALGLAILVAVSAAWTNAIAANLGSTPTPAEMASMMTSGFQVALYTCAGFIIVGIVIAVLLICEKDCIGDRTSTFKIWAKASSLWSRKTC